MSVENFKKLDDGSDLNLWSTDELRDKARAIFSPDLDTSIMTRQELIQILEVAKTPTAEEIASQYQFVFNIPPAKTLTTEEQQKALLNVENHRYELWAQEQDERNEEKRKFRHV